MSKLYKLLQEILPELRDREEPGPSKELVTTSGGDNLDSPEPSQSTQAPITEPTVTMPTIQELTWGMRRIEYTVQCTEANRSEFARTLARFEGLRFLWKNMPLAFDAEPYGSTAELFTTIQSIVFRETHVLDRVSRLLTFWIISTWFKEVLDLAPCLIITGRAYEGETILRYLSYLCHHPLLLAGISNATLKGIDWNINPTLLISEPNLTSRMAALLGCSAAPGYFVLRGDKFVDYSCPKAVYVGENLPAKGLPQNCIHIDVTGSKIYPRRAGASEVVSAQCLRNQLLSYRLENLPEVASSEYRAPGLSYEAKNIADTLGRCIVDAPELRAELVSLLMWGGEQRLAELSASWEAVIVHASLKLCHQEKAQVFAREIAAEANSILESRGEKLRLTAEKVGHRLKKVGLHSHRLGKGGNGLVMDQGTRILLHELATIYMKVPNQEDEDLHCPLCKQNQQSPEVVEDMQDSSEELAIASVIE